MIFLLFGMTCGKAFALTLASASESFWGGEEVVVAGAGVGVRVVVVEVVNEVGFGFELFAKISTKFKGSHPD